MVDNRFAALRKMHGLSQRAVGAYLNTTLGCVSKYELGVTEPNIENLKAMSRLFGVSIDFLLCQSDIPLPPSMSHRSVDWKVPNTNIKMPFEDFCELSLLVNKYFSES